MTRPQAVLLAAALTAALCAPAGAQTPSKMVARPESRLTLAGGSNVHDWSCSTTALRVTISLDAAFAGKSLSDVAKPIGDVSVAIPVTSIKCGKGKMDDNLYKALHAEQFPDIKYVLTSYTVDASSRSEDRFEALTVGELTVAGTTKRVEIPIRATRLQDGAARGEGTFALKMTDVGIKPPNALMGAMRTKNDITITFVVLLEKDTAIALGQ